MEQVLIGAASGALSTILTNPLDVIKTRLQLQGELCANNLHKRSYYNISHAFSTIYKYEGLAGFKKGMLTAIYGTSIYNGCRLGVYSWLSNKFDDDVEFDYKSRFLVGSVSAAVGAILANPFFQMKVQLQSRAPIKIAHGYQHLNKGSLIIALRQHIRNLGVFSLYSGIGYGLPLHFFASGVQLLSFDYSKHQLNKHMSDMSPSGISMCSSMIGGISSTIFLCPGECILTRLYNQGYDTAGKPYLYKGFWDCWYKTFSAEGVYGLYKGLNVVFLREGPNTVLMLSMWDLFKFLEKMWYENEENYNWLMKNIHGIITFDDDNDDDNEEGE